MSQVRALQEPPIQPGDLDLKSISVGDTILINKRSVANENSGIANLMPAKEVRQKVVVKYLHGAVQTETGDVWMPHLTRKGWVGGW